MVVVIERLLLLAQSVVDFADVVEREGFPQAVPNGAEDRQGLIVVIERLLLFAQSVVDFADVVERGGFPGAVPHGAEDR